jgi:hypothetical protein
MKIINLNDLIIFCFVTILTPSLFAQKKPTTAGAAKNNVGFAKFGGSSESYTGDKNKSISNGGIGYGGEIGVDAGLNLLRYYAKLKVFSSSGNQDLLDNTVETKTKFSLIQIAPEVGISLYPVGRNDKGLNLYFFGGGIFSMNLLELKPVSIVSTGAAATTFTKLQTKQQGFGYGPTGGIGFEIVIGSNKTSKKMIYGEFGAKQITAKLADRTDFQINSLFFTLGFGL